MQHEIDESHDPETQINTTEYKNNEEIEYIFSLREANEATIQSISSLKNNRRNINISKQLFGNLISYNRKRCQIDRDRLRSLRCAQPAPDCRNAISSTPFNFVSFRFVVRYYIEDSVCEYFEAGDESRSSETIDGGIEWQRIVSRRLPRVHQLAMRTV